MPLAKTNISGDFVGKSLGPRTEGRQFVNGKQEPHEQYVIVDPAGTAFSGGAPTPLNAAGVAGFSEALGDIISGVRTTTDRTTNPPTVTKSAPTKNQDAASNFGRPTDASGNPVVDLATGGAIFNNTLAADKTLPLFVIHTKGPQFAKENPKSTELTAQDEANIVTFQKDLTASLTNSIAAWKDNPLTSDKKLSLPLVSGAIFGGKAMGARYYEVYLNALDAAMKDLSEEQSQKVFVTPQSQKDVDALNTAMDARGKTAAISTTAAAKSSAAPATPEAPEAKKSAISEADIASIPAPLLHATNISNAFIGKPLESTITTPQYKEAQGVDEEEQAKQFQTNLDQSLQKIVSDWHAGPEKDKPLNLPFDSEANRGDLSRDEYTAAYLLAVGNAMQNNGLTAEEAKRVNICPSSKEDHETLNIHAPQEDAIKQHQLVTATMCDRTINIGEDRKNLGSNLVELKRMDSIEEWKKFLASEPAKTAAEKDTSLGIFYNLLSTAVNSEHTDEEKKAFVKDATEKFAFLEQTPPETNKFAESTNLDTALTKLTESNKDTKFLEAVTSSHAALQESQKKAKIDVLTEMESAVNAEEASKNTSAAADPAAAAADTKKPKANGNRVDSEKVKAVKAVAAGAVTIACMATASVFFPPIGILAIAAGVAWYVNRNKGKGKDTKETEGERSAVDPYDRFTADEFAAIKREEAANKNKPVAAMEASEAANDKFAKEVVDDAKQVEADLLKPHAQLQEAAAIAAGSPQPAVEKTNTTSNSLPSILGGASITSPAPSTPDGVDKSAAIPSTIIPDSTSSTTKALPEATSAEALPKAVGLANPTFNNGDDLDLGADFDVKDVERGYLTIANDDKKPAAVDASVATAAVAKVTAVAASVDADTPVIAPTAAKTKPAAGWVAGLGDIHTPTATAVEKAALLKTAAAGVAQTHQ